MSQKLDINFVAANPFSYQQLTTIGLIWIVLSVLLTAYGVQQLQVSQQRLNTVETKLKAVAPKRNTSKVKPVLVQVSDAELKHASEILLQLSIPWNPLFQALEQNDLKNIALLSIEPNRKKQQIMLTGEAKNLEVTLDYVKQLAQMDLFSQAYLLKHSIDQDDPNKPVSFTILAQWKL
ncbi:MAG: hypothetical protein Q7V02_09635 [Methylophilus sp.]|nr:hypothetical protein [Methylophilus sp.]